MSSTKCVGGIHQQYGKKAENISVEGARFISQTSRSSTQTPLCKVHFLECCPPVQLNCFSGIFLQDIQLYRKMSFKQIVLFLFLFFTFLRLHNNIQGFFLFNTQLHRLSLLKRQEEFSANLMTYR